MGEIFTSKINANDDDDAGASGVGNSDFLSIDVLYWLRNLFWLLVSANIYCHRVHIGCTVASETYDQQVMGSTLTRSAADRVLFTLPCLPRRAVCSGTGNNREVNRHTV